MFKKLMLTASSMMIASMLLVGIASAHVVVYPKEATQGSYEVFTVRVPSEKESATVKVEVKFPLDSVAVSRFEPKAGWKYEITKDAAGKITGVTWTATGDGLGARNSVISACKVKWRIPLLKSSGKPTKPTRMALSWNGLAQLDQTSLLLSQPLKPKQQLVQLRIATGM